MSRAMLHKRLDRLEAIAPKEPKKLLIIGSMDDVPEGFDGDLILLTGVSRPEDKLHRQCE